MATRKRTFAIVFGLLALPAVLSAAEPKAEPHYRAVVTILTAAADKPWTTIAMPTVVFTPGRGAEVHIADDAHDIRLQISTPQAGKAQFQIEATIITNPKAKTPSRLASPRLLLEPGKPGQIQVGEVLRIEAAIEKVKAVN